MKCQESRATHFSWGGEEKQVMVPEPEKATHDGI